MHSARSTGHLRFLSSMAALAVLAALLLSPGQVFAAEPVFNTGLATSINVAENTASGTDIGSPYTATDTDMGDTLTYHLSGTDASSFNISSTGQLSTDTTLDFETKSSYSVTVGVRDSTSDTTDDATIAVTINLTNVNEAPDIVTNDTTYDFAENTAVATAVVTVDATDPDSGFDLTWTLTGEDAADFAISEDANQDGVLKFQSSPNYESAADDDTNNVYKVTVNVRDSLDGSGTADTATDDTINLEITVTNEDEAGTVTITGTLEGGEELAASVTDLDGSVTGTTWQWSRGDMADGTGFDDISGETSATYASVAADVGKYLKATASYTDPQGSGKSAEGVTSSDIDASNSEPKFPPSETGARNVDENTAANIDIGNPVAATDSDSSPSLTYALTGTDASSFNFDTATGQIKTKDALNFEMKSSYSVNVTVHDGLDAASDTDTTVDDTQAVTITVNDVNEAPTITTSDTTKNVPENTTTVLTFAASDVDNNGETDDSDNTLTWSVESTADGGKFSINSATGALTFSNAPDFETPTDVGDTAMNNTYVVTVKVTDNGINGARVSSNHLSATRDLTVTVVDVNERPVVSGTAGPSFPEIEYDADATAAELVIGTYSATDDDNTDNVSTDADFQTITWDVSGTDSAHFSIDSTSGELSFSIEPDFENEQDANTDNDYVVVVEADDNEGETNSVGTFTLTVTVTNVDETPEFTNPPADRDFAEIEYDFDGTPDLVVASFTARDEEMEDITWILASGGDSDDLSITENIDGEGVVSFNSAPNFEMSTGSGTTSNIYEFTVVITDATASPNTDANERTHDYVVTVTDVNEKPDIDEDTVDDYPEVDFYFEGTLSSVHTFTATDYDDMGADPFTWSLGGDDMGDFSISNEVGSEGVLTFVQDNSLMVGPLPSYEDPQDDDTDNIYSITVIATDDEMYAGQYAVTITVTDEEEAGRVAADLPNDPPLVGDVLTFTLSDPDGEILLTDGDIDWTIEAREPAVPPDPAGDWETIVDADPLSLVKTYTVDEDYTGKEIRATVEYEDRRGSMKEATSDQSDAAVDERDVAPPRFREGASQTIAEGEAGRNTEVEIMATDRDGEVLIFGIRDGKDADLFEILPSDSTVTRTIQNVNYTGYTTQLRAIETLDYETVTSDHPDCPSKSLCLTLTLSDGSEFSNGRVIYDDEIDVTYDVTIEVTDVEEPGEITFSPEEVPEPEVEITATHIDPDGSVSGRMWQWQRSEDPEAETPVWTNISGVTSSTYTPSATSDVISGGDNDGDGYYLRATVTYTDGSGSDSAEAVAGQVGTANTRPQFPDSETGQRTVPENSRSGTNIGDPVAAEDPENNSLTYTLTGVDAESFTIVSSTGQLRVKEPLDFEEQEVYIVTIEVSDRRDAAGRSSTHIDDTLENLIIRVENVEEPGTVTLTTDTNKIQATVPVTAALSDPDDPSGVSWQWARSTNRSDWEDIATGATYTPSETDEGDTDEEDQGNYLRARATYPGIDGKDQTPEPVTSRVAAPPPTNAAPVFLDAEDGQREVREDASSGTTVEGPVQATDFNNDTLTYTLSGSDATSFTIDASGQLRLELEQDVALDYERKRSYRFTVQVSDGKNDDGDDDDPNNLRVDDSITVTVGLIDVNEAPVITGEAGREFRENGTGAVATYSAKDPEGDDITWSVGGTDGDDFVITDRGQLYFKEPPSFEDGETYTVNVIASDGDTTLSQPSMVVTVTVTDVEERGKVILQPTKGWFADAVPDDLETQDIDESIPELRTRFTATLTDGDEPITNLSWQWYRSSSEEIADATSSSYIATTDDVNRTLRVTATYRDNRSTDPMDPMKITEKTVTASLRASIRDTSPGVNTQPYFTVPTAEELPGAHLDTRTITSGAVAGRSIGSRVSARDAEGDLLTYMLRGRNADNFELDTATGQLRTKEALDHLEPDTYTLSVSVHDGFDAYYRPSASIDDTISIIITVTEPPPPRRRVRRSTTDDTPPNRPAEFSDGEATNRSVLQGVEAGTDVGRPVAASDPDGDTLTYTLGGTDADTFDIDAMTGQLKTKAALDAETKSAYSVTVSVTDNKNAGGGRLPEIDDTITVTITVTTVELSEIAIKYDADEDGLISRDEALAALNDFFSGDITRDEALGVIALYFESPATVTELLEENGEENG